MMITQIAETERVKRDPLVCPLCHAKDVRSVITLGDTALLRCCECRLGYISPSASIAAIVSHFGRNGVSSKEEEQVRFQTNRDPVLGKIVEYIQGRKHSGRILDIGCATGHFLNYFAAELNWQAYGVELSSNLAQIALRNGLNVFCGDVFQAAYPDEYFDVITVLDTFYYFPQPIETLSELRRILKPEGIVILDLPLNEARIWRATSTIGRMLSGTRQSLVKSSDHLFYYGPKSVAVLAERGRFNLSDIRLLPGNRHPKWFRDSLSRVFSDVARILQAASRSRLLLGPRFLVTFEK